MNRVAKVKQLISVALAITTIVSSAATLSNVSATEDIAEISGDEGLSTDVNSDERVSDGAVAGIDEEEAQAINEYPVNLEDEAEAEAEAEAGAEAEAENAGQGAEGNEGLSAEYPTKNIEPGNLDEKIGFIDQIGDRALTGGLADDPFAQIANEWQFEPMGPMGAELMAAGDTISVDTKGSTPESIVEKLIDNSNITKCNNISTYPAATAYVKYNDQRGIFSGGKSVFGIESGIILSTGNAVDVQPGLGNESNRYTDTGTSWSSTRKGDDDLNKLVTYNTTCDASVLAFDFTPDSNYIAFNYVFASEEYNEYINSTHNDVFAFFVNGKNYALVPETKEIVSVKTINHKKNNKYYVNNSCHDGAMGDNAPKLDANKCAQTEMDGFTKVMQVVAPVNKGVSNSIKLAIQDVDGGDYDSLVLISGMRSIPCNVCLEKPEEKSVNETDSTVIFTVKRDITAGELEVKYTLTNGSAKSGTDYSDASKGSVKFTDGKDFAEIEININDRSGYQGDRDFLLALTKNDSLYTLATPNTGKVTILEMDKEFTVTQRFLDASGTKIKNDTTTKVILPNKYSAASNLANNFTQSNIEYEYVGYIIGDYSSSKKPTEGLPSNIDVSTNTTICFIYQMASRSVTVSKTVKGSYTDLTKEYSFTIYLMDSTGKKLNSGTKFDYTLSGVPDSGATAPASGTLTLGGSGEYKFSLKHNQSIAIEGVASNGRVQIVEEEVQGYTTTYTETVSKITKTARDTGVINIDGADRAIAFTNTREYVPPTGISDVQIPVYLIPIVLLTVCGAVTGKIVRRYRKD